MSAHRREYVLRLNDFCERYASACEERGEWERAQWVRMLAIPVLGGRVL